MGERMLWDVLERTPDRVSSGRRRRRADRKPAKRLADSSAEYCPRCTSELCLWRRDGLRECVLCGWVGSEAETAGAAEAASDGQQERRRGADR